MAPFSGPGGELVGSQGVDGDQIYQRSEYNCEGGDEESLGLDVRSAGVVRTFVSLAVHLEALRRRMAGRRGVNVFYTQERTKTRMEIYIDGVALKMRIEAGTTGVADAAVALVADIARSIDD